MNIQKTQQGFGIVKVLVSMPLLLIGLVILAVAYTELNKAYWDYRVKELCEKDGGVTVFETVKLTKDEYENLGVYISPTRSKAKSNGYFFESETEIIREKNPIVRRYVSHLYRSSDKKLLGTRVGYSRIGGDIPTGISHPSGFSCTLLAGMNNNITGSIFIIKGE